MALGQPAEGGVERSSALAIRIHIKSIQLRLRHNLRLSVIGLLLGGEHELVREG